MSELHFDTPAGSEPDRSREIRRQAARSDRRTTQDFGAGAYAYEYHQEAPNAAYWVMLGAGIARAGSFDRDP